MAGTTPRQWKKPETPFAARVQRALKYANLSHTEAAHRLSNRLKRVITPQAIQYVSVKAASSAYATDLAAICGVDPEWLASNNGNEPGTGNYEVRELPVHKRPPPLSPSEKLRHLIDARTIPERDLELLLQMAERMVRHNPNGA